MPLWIVRIDSCCDRKENLGTTTLICGIESAWELSACHCLIYTKSCALSVHNKALSNDVVYLLLFTFFYCDLRLDPWIYWWCMTTQAFQ